MGKVLTSVSDSHRLEQLPFAELVSPPTLIEDFKKIRNYLAANATGITRDATIVEQVVNLLFCKIYDERHKEFRFKVNEGETDAEVQQRLIKLFEDVKSDWQDGFETVFTERDTLELDKESIAFIVRILQHYHITSARRDVVGEAFEALIGPALRGEEGQFFTPRNVVRLLVDMIDPQPGERIIDPACGSGGFLHVVLEYLWRHIEDQGKAEDLTEDQIWDRKKDVANRCIYGLDKDAFLAKIAKAYLAIIGDGGSGLFCENSLLPASEWSKKTQSVIGLEQFDVVLTNPPFGAKIPIVGKHILSQYDAGFVWKTDKEGNYIKTAALHTDRPPQILFVERCLQFLKPGGRMAIVLPEGILGNANTSYLRHIIRQKAVILAIVDCPLETFLPSTSTKVGVLLLQKLSNSRDMYKPIFMAMAEKCGHDRRGVPIYSEDGSIHDDFPKVSEAFRAFRRRNNVQF